MWWRMVLGSGAWALAGLLVCTEAAVAQEAHPPDDRVHSVAVQKGPRAGPAGQVRFPAPTEYQATVGACAGRADLPSPLLVQEYQEDEPGSFLFGVIVGAIAGKLVAQQSEYYDAELLYVPLGALMGGVVFWTAGWDFPGMR